MTAPPRARGRRHRVPLLSPDECPPRRGVHSFNAAALRFVGVAAVHRGLGRAFVRLGGVVIQDAHGHREQAVALLRRRIERWSVQARPGAPIWVAGSAAGAGGAVEPPPSVPAAPLWPLR